MTRHHPRRTLPAMGEIRTIAALAFIGLFIWAVVDNSRDEPEREAAPTRAASASTSAPSPYKVIEGDGTHQMGGMGGKNWGVWQARNPTGKCVWSIRLINPYTGAIELDSGGSERTRVSVQPPGSVSLSGEVDGGRVVFITSGCGTWRLVD